MRDDEYKDSNIGETLTFLRFELLGDGGDFNFHFPLIHFPLAGSLFDGHFYIFTLNLHF